MKEATTYYRLAVGVAVATVLFLVLAIGALGIIGDGGRPDRVYASVLAVAAIGTLIARLRAHGMALALLATALAQVLVTATALIGEVPGTEDASALDIVGINLMYAVLWSLSAWLFWRAADVASSVTVSDRD